MNSKRRQIYRFFKLLRDVINAYAYSKLPFKDIGGGGGEGGEGHLVSYAYL